MRSALDCLTLQETMRPSLRIVGRVHGTPVLVGALPDQRMEDFLDMQTFKFQNFILTFLFLDRCINRFFASFCHI